MDDYLFAIISNSPERISKCVDELNKFTPRFMFFSDCEAAFSKLIFLNINLLIIDNVNDKESLDSYIKGLRHIEKLNNLIIIVITKDYGCEKGIMALNAGADDYLSFSLISKELSARVSVHLNKIKNDNTSFKCNVNIDIDNILPIEDRLIIKNSLFYISNNIDNLKGVYDLSFYLGKSERIINKAFTEHLGKTAFEYIRDFRVHKAQYLLNTTRMHITQIAEEVGYSSAANFSTAFRTVVGLSPKDYRRQKLAS